MLLGDGARVLGHLGRDIERTLTELGDASEAARVDAEYRCAAAVWRYFVQREALGLTSHEQAIELYGIPPTVLAKVGAQWPPSNTTGLDGGA
jgi:hypothetical protein